MLSSGQGHRPALAPVILIATPIPPLQHPQGAEGVPAAGGADALHLEIGLSLVPVLQRPAAVLALAAADEVDRLGEARVAGRLDGLEIIEGPEHVIVPARRKRKLQK